MILTIPRPVLVKVFSRGHPELAVLTSNPTVPITKHLLFNQDLTHVGINKRFPLWLHKNPI